MLENFWLKIPSEGCQKINNTKFNFAIPHLSHKCIANQWASIVGMYSHYPVV